MPGRRRGPRPARRPYHRPGVVLLPPIEVPLDAEHEQRALVALAELLAPLFSAERLAADPPRSAAASAFHPRRRPPAPGPPGRLDSPP